MDQKNVRKETNEIITRCILYFERTVLNILFYILLCGICASDSETKKIRIFTRVCDFPATTVVHTRSLLTYYIIIYIKSVCGNNYRDF